MAQPIHDLPPQGFGARRATRVAAGLAGLMALSGCLASTADEVELSNMRLWNAIPKSTANQFVTAFADLCAAPIKSGAAFEATLRAADYVPTGRPDARGTQVFLVDDRRPAIMVRDTTGVRACGVAARARTGQRQRVNDDISTIFPGAREVPADRVEGAEQVWLDTRAPGRVIFTSRDTGGLTGGGYRLSVIDTGRADAAFATGT